MTWLTRQNAAAPHELVAHIVDSPPLWPWHNLLAGHLTLDNQQQKKEEKRERIKSALMESEERNKLAITGPALD